MGRISPSPTSWLPLGLALLVGSALSLAVGLGVAKLLLTASPDRLFPAPFYSPVAVPGTSDSPDRPGAAGADFAQIYFGARALRAGRSPYAPPSPDPFGRRPGYAPLTYWLAVPLTALPYRAALLAHTVMELLLFVAATVVALRLTGALPHLPAVLCTAVPLLLMTPVGLAHLERGQFDLYVGACYLLAVTYLFQPRVSLVVAAGVLAAVKWTALPVLGALALFVLVAGPRGSRRLWILAAPLVALASFLLLPDSRLLEHLRYWEVTRQPQGLTFAHLMPAWLGKVLPLLTVLVVASVLRWRCRQSEPDRPLEAAAAPLGLALAIQGVAFGTATSEYRAVSFLGLVPALAIWVERADGVPAALKGVTVAGFGLFLVVAFRVHNLTRSLSPRKVVLIYLVAAVCFSALAAILAWRRPGPAPAASAAA